MQLLISRFQVQVLMGTRLAGNFDMGTKIISFSPGFQSPEHLDQGSPSSYSSLHVWAIVGHEPDLLPVSIISLPLVPWPCAKVWVLCNRTCSGQTSCWPSVHWDVPNALTHFPCLVPGPPLICPTDSIPASVFAKPEPKHPFYSSLPNRLCWWSWSSSSGPLTILN